MNCYTTHVAERAVPIPKEEFYRLNAILEKGRPVEGTSDDAESIDYESSELGLSYDTETGTALLKTAGDSSDIHLLPSDFLKDFGRWIGEAGLPYLSVGYANTADKLCAYTHGGGECRIYPDGTLEFPVLVWGKAFDPQTYWTERYKDAIAALVALIKKLESVKSVKGRPDEVNLYFWGDSPFSGVRITEISVVWKKEKSISGFSFMGSEADTFAVIYAAEMFLLVHGTEAYIPEGWSSAIDLAEEAREDFIDVYNAEK